MQEKLKSMTPLEIDKFIAKTDLYKSDFEYMFFCEHADKILKANKNNFL
jgi:hypothetical protein